MLGWWRFQRPDEECEQQSVVDETVVRDKEAATCREIIAVALDEKRKPQVVDRKTSVGREIQSGDIINSKSTLYLQK
jgi:hypothetical protein